MLGSIQVTKNTHNVSHHWHWSQKTELKCFQTEPAQYNLVTKHCTKFKTASQRHVNLHLDNKLAAPGHTRILNLPFYTRKKGAAADMPQQLPTRIPNRAIGSTNCHKFITKLLWYNNVAAKQPLEKTSQRLPNFTLHGQLALPQQ